MPSLYSLTSACQAEQEPLLENARGRVALWDNWLLPLPGDTPKALPLMLRFCWDSVIDKKTMKQRYFLNKGTGIR